MNTDTEPAVDPAYLDAFVEMVDNAMLVVTAAAVPPPGDDNDDDDDDDDGDGSDRDAPVEHGACLVGFHTQSSIDPWRYTVCISKANHTHAVAARATHLLVHLLGANQRVLAELCGGTTDDEIAGSKLDRLRWVPGPDERTPLLVDIEHWFLGRIEQHIDDAGDHGVFVLRAVASAGDGAPAGAALRYHDVRDIPAGHPA